jgi:proteasome lid subunit RPN8/RPN11
MSKVNKFPGIRGLGALNVPIFREVDVYAEDSEESFDAAFAAGREQPYPVERERVALLGLDDAEGERSVYGSTGPGRVDPGKRTCTSKKLPFEYLRFDTCVTPMKNVKELPPILNSRDVVEIIRGAVSTTNKGREFFVVMCVNARNMPIGITVPHVGGRTFAMIEASVVMQAVMLSGAAAFICAHNHPSGDPTPSADDIEITRQLVAAGKLLKVDLLDHIVMVDDGQYTSFLDRGLMPR